MTPYSTCEALLPSSPKSYLWWTRQLAAVPHEVAEQSAPIRSAVTSGKGTPNIGQPSVIPPPRNRVHTGASKNSETIHLGWSSQPL